MLLCVYYTFCRELKADLEQLIASSVTLADYPSLDQLLSQICQVLPLPLSRVELADLCPTQQPGSLDSQSIAAFLFQRLQQTNHLLFVLHASVQWIRESTLTPRQFTASAASALKDIAQNRIPRLWWCALPRQLISQLSLFSALQQLRRGVQFLVMALQSGWSLPLKLHPLWVPSAADLLSRVQLWFAHCKQLPPHKITLEAKVRRCFSLSLPPSLYLSLSLPPSFFSSS